MKKRLILIIPAILTLAVSGYSQHGHSHSESGHGNQSGETKIVLAGDIQVAFDLYDRAKHDDMGKSMGSKEMGRDNKSDHFIIISLMKKPENEIIKNAGVELILLTPGKKSVKKKAHAMEGNGMYHYSAGFQMKAAGNYKVTAVINIKGKKIKAEAEFNIK